MLTNYTNAPHAGWIIETGMRGAQGVPCAGHCPSLISYAEGVSKLQPRAAPWVREPVNARINSERVGKINSTPISHCLANAFGVLRFARDSLSQGVTLGCNLLTPSAFFGRPNH